LNSSSPDSHFNAILKKSKPQPKNLGKDKKLFLFIHFVNKPNKTNYKMQHNNSGNDIDKSIGRFSHRFFFKDKILTFVKK